eukprot:TRINITY_DN56747_c0_g1_i1.p1 TRINITY_DN56747_c0_g1~~TRINITY_DN56747_c0_g1_i1.p1  ORF type:complete len:213 (+),score=33.31 TRINITY_DN56747_c0_g1_i1:89-727(+)
MDPEQTKLSARECVTSFATTDVSSPRKLSGAVSRESSQEPPSTPRQLGRGPGRSVPGAPKDGALPPLLRALKRRSFQQVQAALAVNTDAAAGPIWDPQLRFPLCFAIRCGCDADIIDLLLQYGADASLTDEYGQTPVKLWQEQAEALADRCGENVMSTFGVTADAQRLNRIREVFMRAGGLHIEEIAVPTSTHRLWHVAEVPMPPAIAAICT